MSKCIFIPDMCANSRPKKWLHPKLSLVNQRVTGLTCRILADSQAVLSSKRLPAWGLSSSHQCPFLLNTFYCLINQPWEVLYVSGIPLSPEFYLLPNSGRFLSLPFPCCLLEWMFLFHGCSSEHLKDDDESGWWETQPLLMIDVCWCPGNKGYHLHMSRKWWLRMWLI